MRWHFVINGGIDGFSRAIVFMGISDNNRTDTVLKLFEQAVKEWGLSSRVRSDKGLENVAMFNVRKKRNKQSLIYCVQCVDCSPRTRSSQWSTPSLRVRLQWSFSSYFNLFVRLQSVLNSAAQLVLNISKISNILAANAISVEIHWLPIRRRFYFKITLYGPTVHGWCCT